MKPMKYLNKLQFCVAGWWLAGWQEKVENILDILRLYGTNEIFDFKYFFRCLAKEELSLTQPQLNWIYLNWNWVEAEVSNIETGFNTLENIKYFQNKGLWRILLKSWPKDFFKLSTSDLSIVTFFEVQFSWNFSLMSYVFIWDIWSL